MAVCVNVLTGLIGCFNSSFCCSFLLFQKKKLSVSSPVLSVVKRFFVLALKLCWVINDSWAQCVVLVTQLNSSTPDFRKMSCVYAHTGAQFDEKRMHYLLLYSKCGFSCWRLWVYTAPSEICFLKRQYSRNLLMPVYVFFSLYSMVFSSTLLHPLHCLHFICRDVAVCQWRRSAHTELCDPQWSSSQYVHCDEFPHYRDDSLHGFFSSLLKAERALLCPCGVDTVILSALNLAWLCWDRGFLFSLHLNTLREMECFEFIACCWCDCADFMNSKMFLTEMPPSKLSLHTKRQIKVLECNLKMSFLWFERLSWGTGSPRLFSP